MSSLLVNILESAALMSAGGVLCYLLMWWKEHGLREARARETETLLAKARSEAEMLVRDAQLAANEERLKLRADLERSFAERAVHQAEFERRLSEREALINTQLQRVVDAEKSLAAEKAELRLQAEELAHREREVTDLGRRGMEELQRLARVSEAEARQMFLRRVEEEARQEAGAVGRRIFEEARQEAEERAKRIIALAIQRCASAHTFELTTSSVAIQGDEIKGRIIGREGRNIRAFEAATGVTVMIDDTPGAVLLSGFDPVRREIARESMLRLIADGRIHPTRIEEVVLEVSREIEDSIVRIGEQAAMKAGVGALHIDLLKLLGRLRFRHSYSQNLLDHSVEVAQLMGLMASELSLDVVTARRTGLLHDIGKAVNHEVEGPHALVGAEMLKRCGECEEVVNGVASHHNDVPSKGMWGVLVSAADAISASRPGARSESMTTYLQRVHDLEKLAGGFPGVEKAYAVQAGRELRVLVQPEKVDDSQAFALARGIAARIETDLQYPGQIRVIVVRETRCVEVAK